jgi:D-psicose/D-tagatose/L-ribulose 3-epimerase
VQVDIVDHRIHAAVGLPRVVTTVEVAHAADDADTVALIVIEWELAVEPLNRFETDCINTMEQAVAFIDRVGSPALKIQIDTFHLNIEEDDSVAAILKHAKHIGHVHGSASHRGLLGQDQVNWEGVLGALQSVGYDGDIVIESFSEDNQVIARAAAIWRPLYDSPEQLSVEGLKFLRNTWQLTSNNC